ncbi:hypothetical protein HYT26_03945 [Candidatus Pacearchaeota archaeon]|nr:hypothetical protein [Candidatus Pacearchaeota archaeon]
MKEVKIKLPDTLSLARLCMELKNCRLNHLEFNSELGRLSYEPSYDFIPQFFRNESDTFKIIIEKSCKYFTELKSIIEKFRGDNKDIDDKDIVYILNRPREPINENERPAFFQIAYKIAALEDKWPIFPGSTPYNEIRNEDGEIFTLEYISSEFSKKKKERLFKLIQQYYGGPLVKERKVITRPENAPFIVMALNYAPAAGSANMLLELFGKRRIDEDLDKTLAEVKEYPDLWPGQSLFGKYQEGLIQICKIRPWISDESASIDFCDMYLGKDMRSLKKYNDIPETCLK